MHVINLFVDSLQRAVFMYVWCNRVAWLHHSCGCIIAFTRVYWSTVFYQYSKTVHVTPLFKCIQCYYFTLTNIERKLSSSVLIAKPKITVIHRLTRKFLCIRLTRAY